MNREQKRALATRARQERAAAVAAENESRPLTPEEAALVETQAKVEEALRFVDLIEKRLDQLSKLKGLYDATYDEYVEETEAVTSDIEAALGERIDAQEKLCSLFEDFQRIADPDRMIQLAQLETP